MIGCMCVVGGVTNKLTTLQCWSLWGTACVTELLPYLNFSRWPSQRMARLLWPSKMPKVTMRESTSVWAETSLVEYPTEWDFSWEVGRIFFSSPPSSSALSSCVSNHASPDPTVFYRKHQFMCWLFPILQIGIVSHSENRKCFPFHKSELFPIPEIRIMLSLVSLWSRVGTKQNHRHTVWHTLCSSWIRQTLVDWLSYSMKSHVDVSNHSQTSHNHWHN